MAAKEPYDYLPAVAADYNYTLSIEAQGQVTEEGYKNQIIHMADDNSEERITLSTGSLFYVSWDWNILSESDSGTILDLYHDSAKANGIGNSFYWQGHDTHIYTVRFDMKLQRAGTKVSRWGLSGVRLRLLGISAASLSISKSPSLSPSASMSRSKSPSLSPSASKSPSKSRSKSPSVSPSASKSPSASPST